MQAKSAFAMTCLNGEVVVTMVTRSAVTMTSLNGELVVAMITRSADLSEW